MTITDSYSTGQVSGPSGVGGFAGYNDGSATIQNSYWDMQTSEWSTSQGGTGKTTKEMMQQETFNGWNFADVWTIDEEKDYPELQWEPYLLQIIFETISSPQRVNKPFQISIVANREDFSGRVYFNSMRGAISPGYVDMVNGQWEGNIQLYSIGERNQLIVRWYDDVTKQSLTNASNFFDVTDADGQMPSNAHLQGFVTDDNHNSLVGVSVQLYTDDPRISPIKCSYSTVTDSSGEYSFENIIPGSFYIQFQQTGYQDAVYEIQLAADRIITNDAILYIVCDIPSGNVPVLLVPDIMGSKKRKGGGLAYPHLPSKIAPWNSGRLKLHDPGEKVGWIKLKQIFGYKEYGGYKGLCDIFDVPYDWSLDIESIRDDYLIPYIKKIKEWTEHSKVDIVTHSMGGLVTRSYVQSDKYANDVRKFAMVGTPNKGADLSYYTWEGGDPMKADKAAGHTGVKRATWFYTNTLSLLYKKRNGGEEVCDFNLKYWPTFCNTAKIYDFLHKEGRSSGQLMPIYNSSLLDLDMKHDSLIKSDEENTLVRALNNLDCRNEKGCVDFEGRNYSFVPPGNILTPDSSGVQTKLFVGYGQQTLQSIVVKPTTGKGNLYKDGKPNGKKVYANGDGTVLTSSVIFNDYLPPDKPLPYISTEGEHGFLIRKFAKDIVEFITGNEDTPSEDIEEQEEDQPQLIINIDGRIQPFLVDSYDQSTTTEKDVYNMNSAYLQLVDPSDGKCTVSLKSPYQENYELSVTYFNSSDFGNFWGRRSMGFYDDTLSSFSVEIDNTSVDNPIIFDRAFDGPIKLQMQNISNQVLLTWSDPIGDKNRDVDHYEIYWKYNYEPYFYFLNSTTEKNFTTNQPWTNPNYYAVKSVLKNDNNTLFSNVQYNLDAD